MPTRLCARRLMVFLLLLAAASAAAAQPGRGARMDPEERRTLLVEQLTERLELNTTQQTRVDSILTERDRDMMDLRQRSAGDRAAMRAGMAEVMETYDEHVLGVLTEEQQKAYLAFRKEQQTRGRRRRNP